MSRGDVISDCRFSSETPTRPISKHVAQVWSSWWCKCTCPEERSSLVVDFPHDSLSEHNPGKYVRLCSILFKCCNVSTKSPHNWSFLYTNPYPSNITMFGFVVMANFAHSFRIASPNKRNWPKTRGQIWTVIWKPQNPFPERIINIARDESYSTLPYRVTSVPSFRDKY